MIEILSRQKEKISRPVSLGEELIKRIPEGSSLFELVHRPPDQAPFAKPIHDGRVVFEQNEPVPFSQCTIVRTPLCLLPEGVTAQIAQDKQEVLYIIDTQLPTAAMLFDTVCTAGLKKDVELVWLSEEDLFRERLSQGVEKSPLRIEGDTKALLTLTNRTERFLNALVNNLRRIPFGSIDNTIEEIVEEVARQMKERGELDISSKHVKSLKGTNAARIVASHALFPLIIERSNNMPISFKTGERINGVVGVQGPLHLESHPPRWKDNPNVAKVAAFSDAAVRVFPRPHRAILPVMIHGEPIAEFDVGINSPQIGRGDQSKLLSWAFRKVFPLSENPVFGHAIGIMELAGVQEKMQELIMLENEGRTQDIRASVIQLQLIIMINSILSSIGFWNEQDRLFNLHEPISVTMRYGL